MLQKIIGIIILILSPLISAGLYGLFFDTVDNKVYKWVINFYLYGVSSFVLLYIYLAGLFSPIIFKKNSYLFKVLIFAWTTLVSTVVFVSLFILNSMTDTEIYGAPWLLENLYKLSAIMGWLSIITVPLTTVSLLMIVKTFSRNKKNSLLETDGNDKEIKKLLLFLVPVAILHTYLLTL